MKIEFDPVKSDRNAAERGLPLAMAADLDWSSAATGEDTRFAYPERRFVATAYLGDRLHIVCYVPIPDSIRVISSTKPTPARSSAMNHKPLTDEDGEVRELTKADMRRMRPFAEVHPELADVLQKRRPGQRGPGKRPSKKSVTLRLEPEILEHFRATGPGWQVRINDALAKVVRDR